MAVYNSDYATDALDKFIKAYDKDFKAATYSMDVDKGFDTPPIKEMFRFISDTDDKELQDTIARRCILHKQVTFLLDGKEIGSFVLNGLNDPWELIQIFNDHPLAYSLLLNNTTAFIIKKYTPLPSVTANAVAAGQM